MFSIGSAILHFVIGGIAVALASIIADKVGGKLGGIIATMPAVFLAAIIALALDHRGTQLVEMSMNLQYWSNCRYSVLYINCIFDISLH